MTILVTGGAGYIGSHTVLELLNAGDDVVVMDNLSNSSPEAIKRVQQLTGKTVKFYETDILDRAGTEKIFSENKIEYVIHFAGLKAVGESVAVPLKYFRNNIAGTVVLLEVMQKYKVKKIIFSSSATVYGAPETVPIKENFPLSVTNPYGRTKLMIEEILKDLYASDKEWSIVLLRYFNPIGAHRSGRIGEDPNGVPNNLVPYISQVAIGKLKELSIYGNDYPTKDGTGVRDYIHVVDLSLGHLAALKKLSKSGINIYNLGTGIGYSVLDLVNMFSNVSGKNIKYKIVSRRSGDIAECYADPAKASFELGWRANLGLRDMCEDTWRWQSMNPDGYKIIP